MGGVFLVSDGGGQGREGCSWCLMMGGGGGGEGCSWCLMNGL